MSRSNFHLHGSLASRWDSKSQSGNLRKKPAKAIARAGCSSFYEQVPARGLEPPRGCPQWILNPSRLPIPPHRQTVRDTPPAEQLGTPTIVFRHGTCVLNCLESPKRDFAVGIRLRRVIISEGRVKIIRIGFLDVIDYVIIRIRPASRKRHHRPEALQEDTQAS